MVHGADLCMTQTLYPYCQVLGVLVSLCPLLPWCICRAVSADHITFRYHMPLKNQILEILSSTASLLASQPALTYAGEDLKLSGCWMVAMGFQKGREKSPSKAQMDGLPQWLAWPFSLGTPLRKHPWRSWLILLPLSLIHLDILGNLDEELSIRY